MYSGVFIVCDGYLCFDVLGFLREIDKKISRAVIWTAGGAASLIVFLKCLGFTYDQMVSKLQSLSCLPHIIYGGSLEPGTSVNIKREIAEWMMGVINATKLFSQDTTMKDIYKLTNIFPNIITSGCSMNPKTHGDTPIIDVILTSMCNIGTYDSHAIDNIEYTSFTKYDPYPVYRETNLGDVTSKTLYIGNYSRLFDNNIYSVFDIIENKLIQEYFDRVLKRVKSNKDVFNNQFVMINGIFSKNDITQHDVMQRLINGKDHYDKFGNGEDTLFYMDEIIARVKNQS
jgi:hypothetical protein